MSPPSLRAEDGKRDSGTRLPKRRDRGAQRREISHDGSGIPVLGRGSNRRQLHHHRAKWTDDRLTLLVEASIADPLGRKALKPELGLSERALQ